MEKKKITRNPELVSDRRNEFPDIQTQIKQELYARQGSTTDYFQLMTEMYNFVKFLCDRYMEKHGTSFVRCGFTDETIWVGDIDHSICFYIQF